jgi:ribonuclease HI
MPPDPRAIHISTDGSCYKNPGGRSGCAAIVHLIFSIPSLKMPVAEETKMKGVGEGSDSARGLSAEINAQWASAK